ncbi:LysR family transcriptional regulator [Nocardia sp. CWNU-33]|uniref:LysR family transcriptional regulator n=1 Tax=Nocardia sp. CWNU-33 TaxID=3392117 RepID=UPI00398E66A5
MIGYPSFRSHSRSPTIERYEIETFLTLAEELHFRRTSERLGLSTGRVSQTIKKLERRVGVPLFDRTSRQVVLTATGRRLRDDLRPAYQSVQLAILRAIEFGRGITGTLRVGYSTPWVADLLGLAAEAFQRRNPDCEIKVHEIQLGNPLGPLRSGDLDLQISEFPIDEPDLTVGPVIFSEPRALMVPAQHPFARRDTVSLEDLADAPLVSIHGDIPAYWLDFHLPTHTPSGRPIPQGPTATYWTEVPSHVAAGRGVSPVAMRGLRYHARPGITFVPFHDAAPIEYGLIWPTTGDSALVCAFIQTLLEIAAAQRIDALVPTRSASNRVDDTCGVHCLRDVGHSAEPVA